MSVLDLNLEKYEEPVVVESGEYLLTLSALQLKTSSDGNKYFSAAFDVTERPEAASVFHIFMLPDDKHDAKVVNAWGLNLRKFFQSFDIDYKTLKLDKDDKAIGIRGKKGWAFLAIEEDPEYGTRNVVKRIIVPKR